MKCMRQWVRVSMIFLKRTLKRSSRKLLESFLIASKGDAHTSKHAKQACKQAHKQEHKEVSMQARKQASKQASTSVLAGIHFEEDSSEPCPVGACFILFKYFHNF